MPAKIPLRYIVTENGCWIVVSHRHRPDGYVVISGIRAHRKSYEDAYGRIPEGLYICHKCDNPTCINPDHLFAGTQQDNQDDCKKKGRTTKGEKDAMAKLNQQKVNEIRNSNQTGVSLSKKYRVSTALISLVRNNHIWKS